MSGNSRLTPWSSQTVGPYFSIGLQALIDEGAAIEAHSAETITINGKVLYRDGAPVPDAMLEFWSADRAGDTHQSGFPQGFRRVATGIDGSFSVSMNKPPELDMGDGQTQAPHLLVLIFCRGLLRHLVSRVYFEDEPTNSSDPVLLGVPAERRHTLVARREGGACYGWNVVLQGAEETVFFAW